MEKDFEGWSLVKIRLDSRVKFATFAEREVWWCSMGMNIGYETYGKQHLFTRPVLILKKYNRQTFFGLPMSSKRKNNFYRFALDFNNKHGDVLLDQGRTFDARRLADKIAKITPKDFEEIKNKFKDCF